MKTRPTAITRAATRNSEPASRSKKRTVKAIAKAALAWSEGKEGSCERLPQTCAEGWAANGRARWQSLPIAWLTSSASAAEASAEVALSFHLFRVSRGRGRARRGG